MRARTHAEATNLKHTQHTQILKHFHFVARSGGKFPFGFSFIVQTKFIDSFCRRKLHCTFELSKQLIGIALLWKFGCNANLIANANLVVAENYTNVNVKNIQNNKKGIKNKYLVSTAPRELRSFVIDAQNQ